MNLLLATVLLLLSATSGTRAQTEWKRLGDLATGRCYHHALYLGGGRILVVGGSTGIPGSPHKNAIPLSSCEIIDLWNRTVTTAPSLNIPRSEFVALLTSDSDVVAIGGVTGLDPYGELTPSVEIFERRTAQWRLIGNLRIARRQHVAAFLDDHRILVVGGRHKEYGSIAEAEIFDIRTGTSTVAESYPFPVNSAETAYSFGGSVLVFGGRDGGANSGRKPDVWSYDDALDAWVYRGSLTSPVFRPSCLRLWDHRTLAAGGIHQDEPLQCASTVQVEYGNGWRGVATLTGPRADAALAQWSESRVLCMGGISQGQYPIATTEWIDLSNHRSNPGPNMAMPRRFFQALAVPAHRGAEPGEVAIVAISGMASSNSLTPLVEVFERTQTVPSPVPASDDVTALSLRASVSDERLAITYRVPATGPIDLRVYSSDGREVLRPEEGRDVVAGEHHTLLDAHELASGWYLVQLRSGGEVLNAGVAVVR